MKKLKISFLGVLLIFLSTINSPKSEAGFLIGWAVGAPAVGGVLATVFAIGTVGGLLIADYDGLGDGALMMAIPAALLSEDSKKMDYLLSREFPSISNHLINEISNEIIRLEKLTLADDKGNKIIEFSGEFKEYVVRNMFGAEQDDKDKLLKVIN